MDSEWSKTYDFERKIQNKTKSLQSIKLFSFVDYENFNLHNTWRPNRLNECPIIYKIAFRPSVRTRPFRLPIHKGLERAGRGKKVQEEEESDVFYLLKIQ